MSKRIVMVVTSYATLGDSDTPSGLWLEELAAAYYVFADAGCTVTIASPQGGRAPIDPASVVAPWLTDDGKRFLADSAAMAKVDSSRATATLSASDFDAVYCVGGVGAAWDFAADSALARLVETLQRDRARVVAGICHGVLGLTGAAALVHGKAVTGVSNAEEQAAGYFDIVPERPEDRLKKLGATYSCAAPFAAHVVSDGNIITGQNPASAAPLAAAILTYLTTPAA